VTAAIVAADVTSGPADAALERLIDSAWAALERHDDLARAATELVPPERLQRMHAPHLGVVRELFERGRRDGAFRDDLALEWLVQVFYSLLHAAADHARLHGAERDAVRAHLVATLRAVVAPA
jgi:TetR/AcrR family transcriptional repressor of mexCD-oprJ operon